MPLCTRLPPSVSLCLVSVLMTWWTFIVTVLLVAELWQCGTESCELISECVWLQRFVVVCWGGGGVGGGERNCHISTVAFCDLPFCLWSYLEKACSHSRVLGCALLEQCSSDFHLYFVALGHFTDAFSSWTRPLSPPTMTQCFSLEAVEGWIPMRACAPMFLHDRHCSMFSMTPSDQLLCAGIPDQ